MNTRFSFRLPAELREYLEAEAKKRGIRLSELVRSIIMEAVKNAD